MPPFSPARRLLLFAFALSVALHAVVLPFVRTGPTLAEEPLPPEIFMTEKPRTPAPRLSPPPTPRPPVVLPRKHAATPSRHLRESAYHAQSSSRNGPVESPYVAPVGVPEGQPPADATGAPVADQTPASTPAPTPVPHASTLACTRPDIPAATLRAAEPELPALAQQQGIHGEVDVVVWLDAASRVVEATVESSPSRVLVEPALAAARASVFRTETHNCAPIPARYLFRVDFTSD